MLLVEFQTNVNERAFRTVTERRLQARVCFSLCSTGSARVSASYRQRLAIDSAGTLVAKFTVINHRQLFKEIPMSNKVLSLLSLAVFAVATAACSTTDNANANINANTAAPVAAR